MKHATILILWVCAGLVIYSLRSSRHPDGTAHNLFRDPQMIRELLKRQEGLRLHPYRDNGNLSIGFGRNLTSLGITEAEAEMLLDADIERVEEEMSAYDYFSDLSVERKAAVMSLGYNLGATRYALFINHHSAMAKGDFEEAAVNIYPDSLYAKQVPSRAKELAEIIRTGDMSE